jgi:hypothetical protein
VTQLADADLDSVETTYEPGRWLLLRSHHTWLLIDAHPDSAVVTECTTVLAQDGGVDELLSSMVHEGIAEIPPFALVRLATEEMRAVVRGGAVIYLLGATPFTVWAQPGTSWVDTMIGADIQELLISGQLMQQQPNWQLLGPHVDTAASIRLIPVEPPAQQVVPPPVIAPAPAPIPGPVPAPASIPEDEPELGGAPQRDDYDFLWGATQRGVSLAAMGLEEQDALASATEAARSAAADARPVDVQVLPPAEVPAVEVPAPQRHVPPVADTMSATGWNTQLPPTDGLIDGVPWLVDQPSEPPSSVTSAAPVTSAPSGPSNPVPGTPVRVPAPVALAPATTAAPPVEAIARVRPEPVTALAPPVGSPAALPPPPGLHGIPQPALVTAVSSTPGPTPVAPDDVAKTVNRAAARAAAAAEAEALISGPTVLAARCPVGHLTQVSVPVCRVCRAPVVPQSGFEVARPSLGVLRLSTGDVVTLDRGVVIGRAPSASLVQSPERPSVLRLQSPHNDLSRDHAEVVLDNWNVYIRDLGSTNGTTVTLPGQPPTRLREHDLFLLEPGALVNLADEVNIQFDVTA